MSDAATKVTSCITCGTTIHLKASGRPRKYCSRKCSAYEQQRMNRTRYDELSPEDLEYEGDDWVDKAFCKKNKVDTELFFPDRGRHNIPGLIAVTCQRCEVRKECLAFAIRNEIRHGVWGGTSERQRRRLRREIKRKVAATQ